MEIPPELLAKGDFIAGIYSGAADADANPKHTLREEMASGGGQTVRIRPAK